MSVVAGVDLGTTSVRVGLFDSDGSILATAQAPLASTFPSPGWVEQDPELLVSIPLDLLRSVLADARISAADVDGIGFACQRATFVAWDANTGVPVISALGWQDRRTQGRVDELRAMGIPATTLASCTKMEWLLAEYPDAMATHAKGRLRVGTVDSWLTWTLTGGESFITDPSNASATGLYDIGRRDWSTPALDLFHIDRSVLPDVTDTASVVGETPAHLLGHPVPLAARAGDQQAACFAHGLGVDDAKLTLGTSAMLDVVLGPDPPSTPPGAHVLPLWRLGDSEPTCLEGSIPAAGGAVEWLVRIGLLDDVADLDRVAAEGRGDITMVPALAGLGTPHDLSAARASFSGISLDTGPADLVLGVLDGLAHRCAELADALEVHDVLPVDGGLTRSKVFIQRLADATGRSIVAAVDPETTLRGAAKLAARATVDDADFSPVAVCSPVESAISVDERNTRRDAFATALGATVGVPWTAGLA